MINVIKGELPVGDAYTDNKTVRTANMMNLMAELANSDGGKYPHAFRMMLPNYTEQPFVLAMRPDDENGVIISPDGLSLIKIYRGGSSEQDVIKKIQLNVQYLRANQEEVNKKVEFESARQGCGVEQMANVDMTKDNHWRQMADEVMARCEEYWAKNQMVDSQYLTKLKALD